MQKGKESLSLSCCCCFSHPKQGVAVAVAVVALVAIAVSVHVVFLPLLQLLPFSFVQQSSFVLCRVVAALPFVA